MACFHLKASTCFPSMISPIFFSNRLSQIKFSTFFGTKLDNAIHFIFIKFQKLSYCALELATTFTVYWKKHCIITDEFNYLQLMLKLNKIDLCIYLVYNKQIIFLWSSFWLNYSHSATIYLSYCLHSDCFLHFVRLSIFRHCLTCDGSCCLGHVHIWMMKQKPSFQMGCVPNFLNEKVLTNTCSKHTP